MELLDLLQSPYSQENQKRIMKLIKKIKKKDYEKKIGVAQYLSWCCYFKNLEAVKYLLKKGSDVNQRSHKSFTPIHWACEKNAVEIVEFILDKYKPNLLLENENKENSFFKICDGIMDVGILEKAVKMEETDFFRNTCKKISTKGQSLASCCLQCLRNNDLSEEEVESIIMGKLNFVFEHGADPLLIHNIEGNNLNLMDFINNNNFIGKYPGLAERLVDYFIDKGITGKIEGKDSRLLYQFAYRGNISIVKSLLKIGYNVDKSYNSQTPLCVAVKNENFEIAQLLLKDPNIDIEKKNKDGFDAIYYAIHTEFKELIFDILERIDLNVIYKNGFESYDFTIPENFNLLHLACYKKNIPLIIYLLEKDFKLDDKDKCSISPIDILAIRDPDNSLLDFINQSPTKFETYAKNKKAGKIYEEKECPICLDVLDEDISTLKCGHVFHTRCIFYLFEQGKCPICREPIKINYKVGKLLDKKLLKSLSRTKKRPVSRTKSLSLSRRRTRKISNNSSIASPSRNNLRITKRNTLSI